MIHARTLKIDSYLIPVQDEITLSLREMIDNLTEMFRTSALGRDNKSMALCFHVRDFVLREFYLSKRRSVQPLSGSDDDRLLLPDHRHSSASASP